MEFKKKTIIWEDNNEPPKDYIGIKSDGKAYEYSYATRSWIESKLIKAEESGGSDGGGSGEIDYEAIYQFYKNKVVESITEEYLEHCIIPEHYTDIELGSGINTEYRSKMGIWYMNYAYIDNESDDFTSLFCEIQTSPYLGATKYIYFGNYEYIGK